MSTIYGNGFVADNIPSGETMAQREEVCAAWHALPDDLRKDQRLTRLYHALGGPRMDDPAEAQAPGRQWWHCNHCRCDVPVQNVNLAPTHKTCGSEVAPAVGMHGSDRVDPTACPECVGSGTDLEAGTGRPCTKCGGSGDAGVAGMDDAQRAEARKAASEALDKTVSEYLEGYEFRGDGGDHTPSEMEAALIADAVAGLIGDDEFIRRLSAWDALRSRPAGVRMVRSCPATRPECPHGCTRHDCDSLVAETAAAFGVKGLDDAQR